MSLSDQLSTIISDMVEANVDLDIIESARDLLIKLEKLEKEGVL